ncbi:MAG TPA: hypothetical protein VNM92_08990 [Thermoanaerobaculia bacterium]|nr:hypothetical protein [Thermoanaerobaculia bacterium]
MIGLLIGVVLVTVGIAVLCYAWMKSTRASQRRIDDFNVQMLALMQEQTAILREKQKHRAALTSADSRNAQKPDRDLV